MLGEDIALPMVETCLSLLQCSSALLLPDGHWSQHPVLKAELEFSPFSQGQGCAPSMGSEGLALQPVGAAQEMVGLASRLNLK